VSDHDDLMIARIARELKKPQRIDPSFDARVMAEIRADRAPRLTPWQWLVRPRSIRISPLGGLGLAGALAASMMLAVSLRGDATPSATTSESTAVANVAVTTPTSVAATPPVQTVQFVLRAPRASSVTLVGDFNDWDTASSPMQKAAGDLWTITIPLTAGRYTYTFIVDGKRWVADPSAPRAPADEFGQPSSVVTVGASAS
jgi:hypothetical protein